MVPPAVRWSGQPVALVDEIECSFNGVERQPGWPPSPAGKERWPEFPCFSLPLREKNRIRYPIRPSFADDSLILSNAYGPCSGKISAYPEGDSRETGRHQPFCCLGTRHQGRSIHSDLGTNLASTWTARFTLPLTGSLVLACCLQERKLTQLCPCRRG